MSESEKCRLGAKENPSTLPKPARVSASEAHKNLRPAGTRIPSFAKNQRGEGRGALCVVRTEEAKPGHPAIETFCASRPLYRVWNLQNLALTRAKTEKRAVKHLQGLYSIAIGLALATAIRSVIDPEKAFPFQLKVLPFFAAYFVTLVPISHGALCHLDNAYLTKSGSPPKPLALFVDWLVLFVESCALLGLAILVKDGRWFSYGFLGLLVFDAVLALVAHFAFSVHELALTEELKWAIINGSASVLLIGILVFLHSLEFQRSLDPDIATYRWVLVGTVAIARTAADYAWCWPAYFPSETKAPIEGGISQPIAHSNKAGG